MDERTLSGVPERYLCAETLFHVDGPPKIACCLVAAHHMAFGPDGDHRLTNDSGDGTRKSMITLHRHPVPPFPQLTSGREIKATQGIGTQLLVIVEHVGSTFGNDGSCMTLACRNRP